MRNGKLVITALSLLLAAGGLARADAANDEKKLIDELHQANQVEMEMGAIAKSNAGSKAVKAYGQMLEREHNQADREIISLAKERQIDLVLPKTGDQQKAESRELDELRQMKGQAFDQKFLQLMVDEHTKDIDKVEKDLPTVQDAKLKTIMSDMLPHLKKHREMAQMLLQKKAG